MALFGTCIYTAFRIVGTGTIVFLGNENPYAGAAQAWSRVCHEQGGDIMFYGEGYEGKAHSNYQKSKNGWLTGTVNNFEDADGVVFRYVLEIK